MTDITFFEPPRIGAEVSQFDDLGSFESAKAVMDVISPVSGKVVAVNNELVDRPEMINEDPYGKGWIAELDLADFESDAGLLLTGEEYSPIVKGKAASHE
jgi:glycine cleavage system H protein